MWKKFGRFLISVLNGLELTATLERFEPGECCASGSADLLFHLRGRAPFRC